MKITKETLRRARRTFAQAALSYILVNAAAAGFGDSTVNVKSAIIGLLVSAVAAGLAAVANLEKKDGEAE